MEDLHVCSRDIGILYQCGNCADKFPTICQLHRHITDYDAGGSFYFDNISKIAFSRYSSVCRGTQTVDMDKPVQRRGGTQYTGTALKTNSETKCITTNQPKENILILRTNKKKKKRKLKQLSGRVKVEKSITQYVKSREKDAIICSSQQHSFSDSKLKESLGDELKETSDEVLTEPLEKPLKGLSKGSSLDDELKDLSEPLSPANQHILIESLSIVRSKTDVKDVKNVVEKDKKNLVDGSTAGLTYRILNSKDKLSYCSKADAIDTIVKANGTWYPDYDWALKLQCDNTSTDVLEDEQSKDIQTKKKNVVCEFCGKSMLKVSYSDHLNLHHGKTPYICEICGKQFSAKNALSLHRVVKHTEEDKFGQCRYCTKKFAVRGHLQTHERTHSNEKNFHCNDCGHLFATKHSLKLHIKYVHGKVTIPHACHLCDKKFKFRRNLLEHIKSHTNKFPCSVCGISFNRECSRKRHMRIHSGEKPHKCLICGHMFIQKTPYWVHMEKHHDLTKSEVEVMEQEQKAVNQHNKPLVEQITHQ